MAESFSNETLHEIQLRIENKVDKINEKLAIQNGRIGKLENWRSLIIGGSIVINAIVVPIVIKLFMER